jgi:hypothetical protein
MRRPCQGVLFEKPRQFLGVAKSKRVATAMAAPGGRQRATLHYVLDYKPRSLTRDGTRSVGVSPVEARFFCTRVPRTRPLRGLKQRGPSRAQKNRAPTFSLLRSAAGVPDKEERAIVVLAGGKGGHAREELRRAGIEGAAGGDQLEKSVA